MGNSKSSQSHQSTLFFQIEKRNYEKIIQLLTQYPNLLQSTYGKNTQYTPLMKASHIGDEKLVQILIEKGASVNTRNKKGQNAMIIAIRRFNFALIRVFLQKQIEINIVTADQLTTLDYAILYGQYEAALEIYQRLKQKKVKNPNQYELISQKYHLRYVNYQIFIQGLLNLTKLTDMNDFLKRPTIIMVDPVIDPRESWSQWVCRVADFQDAPLVERQQLPQQLQPQNRLFGKVHHYLDGFARSTNKQRLSIKPISRPMTQLGKNDTKQELQSQVEYRSVA